jgi:hypothetical protein
MGWNPQSVFIAFCILQIHTTQDVLCKLYSTNSYNFYIFCTNCTVRIHTMCDFLFLSKSAWTARAKPKLRARSASREGKAWAHTLPQPGCAQLPQQLGYTRLPQPWGYTQLPRPSGYTQLPWLLGYTRQPRMLGYTQLPQLLGYTRLPWPVRVCSWGGWVINGIKVQFVLY